MTFVGTFPARIAHRSLANPSPANPSADLYSLRMPAEATLTLVDWFDAHPSTCGFQMAFSSDRGPTVYSNVVRSVGLGLQSALERALTLGMECPPNLKSVLVQSSCRIFLVECLQCLQALPHSTTLYRTSHCHR